MELPLGFGMALAQNEAAMQAFEAMSESEKQAVLRRTHSVRINQPHAPPPLRRGGSIPYRPI